MGDTDTARDALARWIASQLPRFSYSELKTVAVRVERLAKSIADYGNLDLSTDRRHWKLEGAYEGVDRQWYEDAELVFNHDPAFADIREMRKQERLDMFRSADFGDEQPTNVWPGALSNAFTESALEPCPDCEGWLQRHSAGCSWTVQIPASEVAS